jgi:hypothetical protein
LRADISIERRQDEMDELNLKILKAINAKSPTSFVSPLQVNETLGLNAIELGDRLMLLKKSGEVDIITKEYVSSMTLPNFIAKVKLTDPGRNALKKKKNKSAGA